MNDPKKLNSLRIVSRILTIVALLLALISVVSIWFSVSIPNTSSGTVAGSYSILDVYQQISQFVTAFTQHGSLSTNINSSPKGAIVLLIVIFLGAVSTYLIPVLAGLIFLLLPVLILMGLISFAKSKFGYAAGIIGILLFFFALELVSRLGSVLSSPPASGSPFPSGGTITLGYGAYLILIAGILYLAAAISRRAGRKRHQPQTSPPISSGPPAK
ncbi:MAG: hypothetical protein OK439_07085 [Thaumarchaeota archaeon]|nr:hypothetical protein [Nitrososphaerota archaeon]